MNWLSDQDTKLATLNLSSAVDDGSLDIPEAPRDFLFESFCVPGFCVSVLFDAIPLSSASVSVSVPRPLQHGIVEYSRNGPARVHYGLATSCAFEWNDHPRDAQFRRRDCGGLFFEAVLDLSSFERAIIGISFVLQLEDGGWLKNGGHDFYVGGGERAVPCSIEVPFALPGRTEILPQHMLSLYRANPFWLQPMLGGEGLHSCMQETQFIVAQSHCSSLNSSNRKHAHGFLALLPLIDPDRETRASIFGIRDGQYSALRVETGSCSPLRVHDIQNARVCIVTYSGNPYDCVRSAVKYASSCIKTFCTRDEKIASPEWSSVESSERTGLLSRMGFCTWDAFGHKVRAQGVVEAIQWYRREQIPISYVIVDDGWQTGGHEGPGSRHIEHAERGVKRPVLSSFMANEKFSGSLRVIQDEDMQVIAWTTIIGYWGGSNCMPCGSRTVMAKGALSRGLHVNDIEDPSPWETNYEVVIPEAGELDKYFYSYFTESLSLAQGVSGVKVDGQSILEVLRGVNGSIANKGEMSRCALTTAFRASMARASQSAFPHSVVLNCMACGPETIMLSGARLSCANVCWRTSNDHAFPGIEETASSIAWHILCNAMVSFYVGEIFPVTDWDMFRVSDRFAKLHAAARILSGGPLYISDRTPFASQLHDDAKQLLKGLTTSEGFLLRCKNPGRPASCSLFRDPRTYPYQLFKVFNRNAVAGVLGLFNLSPSLEESSVGGAFAPADVEDFSRVSCRCQYVSIMLSTNISAFHHHDSTHQCPVTLPAMRAMLVHISPVFRIAGDLMVAFLGQPKLLNCGAVIACVSTYLERTTLSRVQAFVDCCLHDGGETYVWMDRHTREHLAGLTTLSGQELRNRRWLTISSNLFLVVLVPYVKPYGIRLKLNVSETLDGTPHLWADDGM